MNRCRVPRALALVGACLLFGAVIAAPASTPKTIVGEIVSLDMPSKALTVRVSGEAAPESKAKEVRLTLDDKTTIEKDGQPIGLAELHNGDRVSVIYRDAAGAAVAASIRVTPKPRS